MKVLVNPIPRVSGCVLRLLPVKLGTILDCVPLLLELGLGGLEGTVMVFRTRFPTVTICRLVIFVGRGLIEVGSRRVMTAPVSVLDRGIDRFGDFFAGQTTGNPSHDGANHGSRGSRHCSSSGSGGGSGGGRAESRAYGMGARLTGNRIWI